MSSKFPRIVWKRPQPVARPTVDDVLQHIKKEDVVHGVTDAGVTYKVAQSWMVLLGANLESLCKVLGNSGCNYFELIDDGRRLSVNFGVSMFDAVQVLRHFGLVKFVLVHLIGEQLLDPRRPDVKAAYDRFGKAVNGADQAHLACALTAMGFVNRVVVHPMVDLEYGVHFGIDLNARAVRGALADPIRIANEFTRRLDTVRRKDRGNRAVG